MLKRIIKLMIVYSLIIWAFNFPAPASSIGAEKSVGAPELYIEKPQYKFQTVREGEIVRQAFTIRNKGVSPLEIKEVQTD